MGHSNYVYIRVCVFYSTVTWLGRFHEKCSSFEDIRTSFPDTKFGLGVHGVYVNSFVVDEEALVKTCPLQGRGPIRANHHEFIRLMHGL